jgi:phosphotransferase system  glucose/maltose/N-acetylglucosamine-specific IIC component
MMSCLGQKMDLYPLLGGQLAHANVNLTVDMIYKGVTHAIGNPNGDLTFQPGQYTSGASSIMMFCLPAAAFAMLQCVPKGDNKKMAGSILISAAIVSFTTGITEPLEFTFLFIAP